VTVTSVAAATKRSQLRMCDCTVDSDVGRGDFSLVLGILQTCGHVDVWTCARAIARVSGHGMQHKRKVDGKTIDGHSLQSHTLFKE